MMAFLPLAFLPGYFASWVLKKLNLLRVPPEVELEGLDMAEFQQDFFPEFERVPETIVLPDGQEVEAAPVLLEAFGQINRERLAQRRSTEGGGVGDGHARLLTRVHGARLRNPGRLGGA